MLFRQWFMCNPACKQWKEVSLGNSPLSKLIGSGIEKFENEKIFLATADVQNWEIINEKTMVSYTTKPSRANMQPVKYSVWFAKKGGSRKILMFDNYSENIDDIILSTGFSGLKTTELSHNYIWCFVYSMKFQAIKDSLLSGTVQPDINNEGIESILILQPDNKILRKFNNIVKPLLIKNQYNKKQIRTLENLRDTLLPKLMSGELKVKNFS